MITEAQLARIRAVQARYLNETCSVQRPESSADAAGGQVTIWAAAGTYPCRLAPERDRRLLEWVGAREALTTYYRLTLPHDADIQAHDRVSIGGAAYQVIALWAGAAHTTARRAILARVE